MSDIKLTASMRTNLLSLQKTQSLMDTTQERLSSGLKVNSAIDNPSSYYTSRSLSNRANDLSALLDSMGQGIQTIKAANEGIESITNFVAQAKALVNTALDTKDTDSIDASSKQFDEVLKQIKTLAKDSSYKGVNLLTGDNLTVKFNENAQDRSFLDVQGKTVFEDMAIDTSEGKWLTTETVTAATEFDPKASITKDQVVKVTDADGNVKIYKANADITYTAPTAPAAGDAWEAAADGTGSLGKYADVSPESIKAGDVYEDAGGNFFKAKIDMGDIANPPAGFTEITDPDAVKAYTDGGDVTTFDVDAMNTSLLQVEAAINYLRDVASEFGNNFSILQNREEFTNNIINVLEEGSDKLTLADMNEESANMLALQTRQQLAINSLSLASQASQSVLKLFG